MSKTIGHGRDIEEDGRRRRPSISESEMMFDLVA